jgi:glycosyltransferase involved in cell wall biosynthesis
MNLPDKRLIISHDVIGHRMAGPGIRNLELARVLAQQSSVLLAVPSAALRSVVSLGGGRSAAPEAIELDAAGVTPWPYDWDSYESLAPAVAQAQVIITCGDVLERFPMLEQVGVPIVVDGYDPHTLETLALMSGSSDQEVAHKKREHILQIQCRAGDFFICASERQRDWWLGRLEASGRVNPYTYAQDPSLRRLVDVVPFGLPSLPIVHTKQVLKGVWPGIDPTDRVLLWGGGLWQWLDPLTAIHAMVAVRERRRDVKLVFPGTRHPNRAAVPEMPMCAASERLAEALGLKDRCVFFGDWVPHEDWPSFLAESDVALSLHQDTVEARLAFRSRVLDYVWAGLPMVVTTGDVVSELVERWRLGETVGYGDAQAVAVSVLKLLEGPQAALAAGFNVARKMLTWERAAEPLVAYCRHTRPAPDKAAGYRKSLAPGLEKRCSELEQEKARLQAQVRGYERGRFIRFSRWLRKCLWR